MIGDRQGLDVKTTFLNADLEEKIYVTQPPRFVKTGFESYLYTLQKAISVLKQSSRQLNELLDSFLLSWGFKPSWKTRLYIFWAEMATYAYFLSTWIT